MIKGCIQVFIGVLLWGVTISVGFTWIAFCFGTVIIGILLLFFAPHILLFPPTFISVFANGFLLLGLNNIKRSTGYGKVIDSEVEWVKIRDKPLESAQIDDNKEK
ncbi:hypothetical protein E2R68_09695 [Psychromonas sp. RZ22]|uniref:hypothetical protein n=1 Tax=Psychromonas algarum TaxID=2555643 RepID=UPI001068A9AB|nr:hypothetical protein [Psychromonas sp. RZ22]TEW54142.1 hypothetical protein E2R68_09695 [Psychromonas sp. RZ22]